MGYRKAIIGKCVKIKDYFGLTLEQIAELSEVPKSTVQRFFKTGDVTLETATNIEYALVKYAKDNGYFDEEEHEEEHIGEMGDMCLELIEARARENERYEKQIAELKAEHKEEIKEIKRDNERIIEKLEATNEKLETRNRILSAILIFAVAIAAVLFVIDYFLINNAGWFIR